MEIGSEFYNNSTKKGKNEYLNIYDYSKRYVLSGRTGLSMIAEELKLKVKNVLMPDYCCGSMVAPFAEQGMKIQFYDTFELKNVKIADSVDAVLVMDYFGFVSPDTERFVSLCRERGMIVIVDATQTAFSFSETYKLADYIIISYRKWFDGLCAVVYSKNGFITREPDKKHITYVEKWRHAAVLKKEYLISGKGEKTEFLELFSKANQELDAKYIGFGANDSEVEIAESVDSEHIRNSRRKNAEFLISEVEKISKSYNVQLIYNEIKEEDCPLFVPILVDEEKREIIRKTMAEDNVYCPCHWPTDKRYPHKETMYHKKEISLVCDQRYGLDDMRLQIESLIKALEASMSKEI